MGWLYSAYGKFDEEGIFDIPRIREVIFITQLKIVLYEIIGVIIQKSYLRTLY